jgi:hypothetical protein
MFDVDVSSKQLIAKIESSAIGRRETLQGPLAARSGYTLPWSGHYRWLVMRKLSILKFQKHLVRRAFCSQYLFTSGHRSDCARSCLACRCIGKCSRPVAASDAAALRSATRVVRWTKWALSLCRS